MKELTEAVNSQLASLYGVENVYAGYSTTETLPYVTYTLGSSGPAEYHSSDHNQGTMVTWPITFQVFTTNFSTALSRVEEIVQTFEDTFPTMQSDKCMKVETISQTVEQELEQQETGPIVWRGICIIEFTIARGR